MGAAHSERPQRQKHLTKSIQAGKRKWQRQQKEQTKTRQLFWTPSSASLTTASIPRRVADLSKAAKKASARCPAAASRSSKCSNPVGRLTPSPKTNGQQQSTVAPVATRTRILI